jgi:hypothetical protein
MANLAKAKRLTSGILCSQGLHALHNPDLLGLVTLKDDEKLATLRTNQRKARAEMKKKIEKVKKIREIKGRGEEQGFLSWTTDQCKDYLQYKKQKEDPAMPTRVGQLRTRCHQIMGRISPMISPHASDDEAEAADEAEEQLQNTDVSAEEEPIVFSDQI